MFDPADFELVWPREVFVREARVLLQHRGTSGWKDRVEWLLADAFAGTHAADGFRTGTWEDPGATWWDGAPLAGNRAFLQGLVDHAGELRHAAERAPYWSQRRSGDPRAPMSVEATRARFVDLVEDLATRGYLAREFPEVCVDDYSPQVVDPARVLEELLGVAGLWPLRQSQPTWSEEVFFDLIEVFHDLVARPRQRSWHDYSHCGWHYSEFAVEPARVLYRRRVNRLLGRSALPYRLAEGGEDVGRLVAVSDDAREDLLQRVLTRTEEDTESDLVRHAITQFRARGASEHDKRGTVITLAGVLEARRSLLKTELFRKDEGALFQIANEFSLRHRNAAQKDDYDPVFLDWVFWWYLATIELIDRLLERSDLAQP